MDFGVDHIFSKQNANSKKKLNSKLENARARSAMFSPKNSANAE